MPFLGIVAVHLALWAGVPIEFQSVHIVFAGEHSRDFISGFGHLFVCLPERDIVDVDDLLSSMALSFGADTGPLGKGMWVGEYKLQPCHELARKNSHFDQRELTVFELNLTEEQLAGLRHDLEYRLLQTYPYDFLRHNCGHYIWDWLSGPGASPLAAVYLTPREALRRILAAFPPVSIRTIPSDLGLLENKVANGPPSLRRAVRAALADPTKLSRIQDPEALLLAIKVAEARAGRDGFARLQDLRVETLAGDKGPGAARDVIERRASLSRRIEEGWPLEAEGPAVSVGLMNHPGTSTSGVRIMGEAGLRDAFTTPMPEHVWREVRFLASTVELYGESLSAEVVLVSLSTLRDVRGLVGGSSNGVSAGYTDLANSLGTKGMFFSTWAGISTHSAAGWVGARLSLIADNLDDVVSTELLPGLTWDFLSSGHAAHLEVNRNMREDMGWLMRHDLLLTASTAVRTEWMRTPAGADTLLLSLRIRF